ncbi:beta-glucosidase [Roseateles sp. MS654]|uniref:beta-glucosidase n=1 Tax=Roseateles sp. MS654 TaxID=3412685 RepID=UPI003C2B604D
MTGAPQSPFRSFWMGGYEGADHVNGRGDALDMVRATGHDRFLGQDYRAARALGLRCLRESVGWRLSERAPGQWDFSRAVRMARTARRHGLQVLWTLMHYGVPPDLTLLDDGLIPRFARFAAEAARVLKPLSSGPRFYTPINEISFLAWAASSTNAMGPAGAHLDDAGQEDSKVSGYEIKRRLVRAALAGMDAIRDVDPDARFLHIDPVIHVVPTEDTPELRQLASTIASYQWQAFDMLSGRQDPELGGHAAALDWIGLNHYHSSQWEVPSEKRLAWHLGDPRRQPLSELLRLVWERYQRPLIVAETGHIGRGRADWLLDIADQARRAVQLGVPLAGVCLYPLLDRPDWHEPERWHRSGVWHVVRGTHGVPVGRRVVLPYARALATVLPCDEPPHPRPLPLRGRGDDRGGADLSLPLGPRGDRGGADLSLPLGPRG